MRIGVMIGPERGDSVRKVTRMIDDVTWAEKAGFDTVWVPQIPTDFDALTAIALMGARTERIELGTAVVPLQAQHPIALARQAISAQAAAGDGSRWASDRPTTGSSGTCWDCRTRNRPPSPATTWTSSTRRSAERTWSMSRTTLSPSTIRSPSPPSPRCRS